MSAGKLIILVIAMAVALAAGAQEKTSQTVIKKVPIKQTSPASGHEMYTTYCAVCHGVDGKGAGPAAEALKVPPTDLTVLSQNNGGKFPAHKVISAIRGEANLPAHGTREMPMWGQLFSAMHNGDVGAVQMRVTNLTKYIESLQAK